MRLYYLTSERWAKVILSEKRLKLSTFNELNDPFELLGVALGEKNSRKIAKILQAHWASSLGLLCTSRTWHNPVMWAHYGDKHKGVCLGFDVPDELAYEVKYEPDRLRDVIDASKPLMGLDEEKLLRVLLTKYKDWEYEKEWRLFAELKDRDNESGLYYIDLDRNLVLREIIIGYRCSWPVGAAAKLVGKVDDLVQVFKARPAFDSYSIVRQQQVSMISLKPKT